MLRYMIYRDIQISREDINTTDLSKFLIDELNIYKYNNSYILYKDEKISISYNQEHSIENIVINWLFRADLEKIVDDKGFIFDFYEYLDFQFKNIRKSAMSKSKKYKKERSYLNLVKKFSLDILNKNYNIVINEIQLSNFKYENDHNFFKRELEDIYNAEMHAIDFIRKDTSSISEKKLEKYMINNLDLIEEGLKYIGSQILLKNGRIDILAKDINNQYVIIELKIKEDKNLIWQCISYPEQFKNLKKVNNVRMITLSSEYSNHILNSIKKIGNIETFKYIPKVELGKIKEIKIFPLQ